MGPFGLFSWFVVPGTPAMMVYMDKQREHPEQGCVKCGACTVVCPVFRVEPRESLTARGKMHLLSLPLARQPSGHFEDIFSRCLLCGACETVCSRHLPITELVTRARSDFSLFYGSHGLQKVAARKALSSSGLLQGLVRAGISLKRINALPAHSGLRIKLGLLEEPRALSVGQSTPPETDSENTIRYFSGCLARHLQPSVGRAVLRLAHAGDLQVWSPETQCCCGLAASSAGKAEEARRLAWQNIKSFADGRGPILTSCASCSSHLAAYPELFADDPEKQELARAFSSRVVEFSAFFLNHLQDHPFMSESQKYKRVFYHDPCHLRFTSAGREAPRKLIDRIGNVERVEAADGPQCCGQGGLFHVGYPELSRKIFQRCVDGALVRSPDLVTTTCSGCLMQWQTGAVENNLPVRIRHLALVLADCLG